MKSFKTLILFSTIFLSTQALSYIQTQQVSTVSSPQTQPTGPVLTQPVRDTGTIVLNNPLDSGTTASTTSTTSSSVSSTPQFGIRDLKVSSDGKCQIGATSRVWVGSPCAKIYGPTAPKQVSSTAGSVTGSGTWSSVYDAQVRGPTYEDFRDASGTTATSDSSTSSYISTREAFY